MSNMCALGRVQKMAGVAYCRAYLCTIMYIMYIIGSYTKSV